MLSRCVKLISRRKPEPLVPRCLLNKINVGKSSKAFRELSFSESRQSRQSKQIGTGSMSSGRIGWSPGRTSSNWAKTSDAPGTRDGSTHRHCVDTLSTLCFIYFIWIHLYPFGIIWPTGLEDSTHDPTFPLVVIFRLAFLSEFSLCETTKAFMERPPPCLVLLVSAGQSFEILDSIRHNEFQHLSNPSKTLKRNCMEHPQVECIKVQMASNGTNWHHADTPAISGSSSARLSSLSCSSANACSNS